MMLLLLSLHRVPTPSAAGNVFVVVEGNVVLNGVQRFSEAFMFMLFGLTYAFNLEYPQKNSRTHSHAYRKFVCVWMTTNL